MITTLTLNPAFDVHVSLDCFQTGHENLAADVTRIVGGKGINISRALTENGIDNTPIVLIGNENSTDFTNGLAQVGLNCKTVLCPGRIRENITIHPKSGEETRLSFKGFSCNHEILTQIEPLIDCCGIVTFTGSLPPGVDVQYAEQFLIRLRDNGAKLVIDSKSVPLAMLKRINPWLIKPNAEEIETYLGKMTEAQLQKSAMDLHLAGIENVMISLGGDGALLAAEGMLYRAFVPKIKVLSTIGAGDSAIAGFIAGDATPEEHLRRAVAYGSAACLRESTNPPLAQDIQDIYTHTTIQKIQL